MKEQKRNLLQCGTIKKTRSLARWANEVTDQMGFAEIINLLNSLFNDKLIDRSDAESVHVPDEDVYSQFNEQLILTDTPIDDIAKALLEKELDELLNNLVNLVVKRKSSRELLSMKFFFNINIDKLGKKIGELYVGLIQRALDDLDKIKSTTAKFKALVEDTLQ